MSHWLPLVSVVLAEGEAQPPGNPFMAMLPLFAAVFIMYYLIVGRPQRREQQARKAMLSALKRNDRVLTIGGIIGTVSNISADGDEVTLKVDDNAKVRFVRSSIQKVLSASDQPADAGGEKSS